MKPLEIKLFKLLTPKFKEKEAEEIVSAIKEISAKDKISDDRLTSEISKLRADLYKWIFVSWLSQIVIIVALVKLL